MLEKYLGIFALWLLLVHFQFVLRSKSTKSILILQFREKKAFQESETGYRGDVQADLSAALCSFQEYIRNEHLVGTRDVGGHWASWSLH